MTMAQPVDEPAVTPVCVIGPEFIIPNPLEVIVETNSKGSLLVTDINHKVMLKAKECNTIFHHQLLLLHADDRPIAMVRDKLMTGHKQWKVYLGDSIAKSDMIFSTQAAHVVGSRTNVHVFLANKKRKKDPWDFLIKGSWSKRNCTIYMGDVSNIIAQMRTMEVSVNERFVKDRFMLEVFANVDYAFVVALIAIVDATKSTTMRDRVIEVVTDGIIESAFGGMGP
ncbi:putative tubby-like protein [Helianthus annuus]|nr:putative tubby-like protein [Helianthus annuus]KAJ0820832.1 putative tubby-like protein [Helianthus annuus]